MAPRPPLAVGHARRADAEGGEGGRAWGSDRRGAGADDEEVGGADPSSVNRERAVAPAEANGGAADVGRVDLGVGLAERAADIGVVGERDDGRRRGT
jgi:hypothetical protein